MSDESFNIKECLQRVRARDEAAARSLVDYLHPLVSKIVGAHLPRSEEREDLMQDVFLKLFSRLDQYHGLLPFEHWVSRLTVNTCIDRLRAQRRRPVCRWSDLSEEQQAVLEGVAATHIPEAADRDILAWEVLEKLLLSLAPAERLIIQWMELERKTAAEVSAITGWNSGVVRIRAFRARQKLKALYQRLGDEKL